MPSGINRYNQSEIMEFISNERIEVSELMESGARLTTSGGIEVTNEVIERALLLRDARELRRQLEEDVVSCFTNPSYYDTTFSPIFSSRAAGRPVTERVAESNQFSSWDVEDSSDDDDDNNQIYDEDRDSEPYYNEEAERVKAKNFHPYELPKFNDRRKLEEIVNEYFRQIEYRLRWIFYREEREGFRRRHSLVQPFSPQDFSAKVEKASKPHVLNSQTSKFYDWNLGSSEFIIRLESFQINDVECLRCHFIYKPTMQEIGYQDRVWNGENYREVNITWAEVE